MINDNLSFIKIKNTCVLKEYVEKKKKKRKTKKPQTGGNYFQYTCDKIFRSRKYEGC